MGYLPSERAVRIGQIIRRGTEVTAVYQGQAPWGGVVRVAFDGDRPMLPPPEGGGDSLPEFWPDEEWPEDFSF